MFTIIGLIFFKLPSLNLTHLGLANNAKAQPNSPKKFSYDLNEFLIKKFNIQ
jgi:hypothetical protein